MDTLGELMTINALEGLAGKAIDLAGQDTQSTRKLAAICEMLKDVPIERIKKIDISWQKMDIGTDDEPDYIPLPNLSVELFRVVVNG